MKFGTITELKIQLLKDINTLKSYDQPDCTSSLAKLGKLSQITQLDQLYEIENHINLYYYFFKFNYKQFLTDKHLQFIATHCDKFLKKSWIIEFLQSNLDCTQYVPKNVWENMSDTDIVKLCSIREFAVELLKYTTKDRILYKIFLMYPDLAYNEESYYLRSLVNLADTEWINLLLKNPNWLKQCVALDVFSRLDPITIREFLNTKPEYGKYFNINQLDLEFQTRMLFQDPKQCLALKSWDRYSKIQLIELLKAFANKI